MERYPRDTIRCHGPSPPPDAGRWPGWDNFPPAWPAWPRPCRGFCCSPPADRRNAPAHRAQRREGPAAAGGDTPRRPAALWAGEGAKAPRRPRPQTSPQREAAPARPAPCPPKVCGTLPAHTGHGQFAPPRGWHRHKSGRPKAAAPGWGFPGRAAPDPSCCAVPLNQPHRNSPFLCRFPNGDVLHRLSPQPDGFPFFPDHYIRFCALFSSGNLHQFSVPRKPPPRRARSCALSRSSLPRPGRAQKKQPSCRTAASHVVAEAGFEPTTFGL